MFNKIINEILAVFMILLIGCGFFFIFYIVFNIINEQHEDAIFLLQQHGYTEKYDTLKDAFTNNKTDCVKLDMDAYCKK